MLSSRTVASVALLQFGLASLYNTSSAPVSWVVCSLSVWFSFLAARGWARLSTWDRYQLAWALGSTGAFFNFVTVLDPEFKGWGDVYYFCGNKMLYCTCEMRWNLYGWSKACLLWNFVLSAAVGLQKLIIHAGLSGLLPGEDVVTKGSFVSIGWRLVPYFLNNWEKQWGAECSSMLFELPHYALELLVVLPLVQIICARLRILALPPGRGLVAPFDAPPAAPMAHLAPHILAGTWHEDASQQHFTCRLRANARVVALVVAVTLLASFNALVVPLVLERTILAHPRTPASLLGQCAAVAALERPMAARLHQSRLGYLGARLAGSKAPAGGAARRAAFSSAFQQHPASPFAAFEARGCTAAEFCSKNLDKHAQELAKVCAPGRTEAILLIEATLAIMRLSCEKLFVLAAVFMAYLLFRDDVPLFARVVIRINHRVCYIFQRVILYSFPAVCWTYGAGFWFSVFASIVFWSSPLQRMVESVRRNSTVVRPVGLKDATEEHVERMNGSCAVCWGEMGVALPRAALRLLGAGPPGPPAPVDVHAPGKALPCGHAFHTACIRRWLTQCHGQERKPTCPMCNAPIELEVMWRLPHLWSAPHRRRQQAAQPPQDWHGGELQAILDDSEGQDNLFADEHWDLVEAAPAPQPPAPEPEAPQPGPASQDQQPPDHPTEGELAASSTNSTSGSAASSGPDDSSDESSSATCGSAYTQPTAQREVLARAAEDRRQALTKGLGSTASEHRSRSQPFSGATHSSPHLLGTSASSSASSVPLHHASQADEELQSTT